MTKKMSKEISVCIIIKNKRRHSKTVVLFSFSDEINKIIDDRIDNSVKSVLSSVNKKLDFVTKKLSQFYNSSSFVSFYFLHLCT